MAAHGVLAIHFEYLLKDWYDDVSQKEDAIISEEGAVLFDKNLQSFDEIPAGTEENVVVKEIDAIANELHHRLDTENISLENAEQVIRILNTILIDEMGFQGNWDPYVHNFSIQHVLESRKGNQIILLVLYKCICRRVGMPVQIICLCRNFVMLRLPNDHGPPLFVDVVRGGRILSLQECQNNVAASLGVPWRSDLFPARDILQYLIDGVEACPNERGMHQRQRRNAVLSHFTELWSQDRDLTFGSDSFPQDCYSEPCLVLDARLFRRYNLISDETLNSIESQDNCLDPGRDIAL